MDDKTKWNEKYNKRLNDEPVEPEPNRRLKDRVSFFSGGTALDIACGLGGNSILLAEHNFHVQAIDISDVAIKYVQEQAEKKQLPIDTRIYDLTKLNKLNWKDQSFDIVVITYYLDRALFPIVKSVIKENGYFFMETYYLTPEKEGKGVSNQYKLQPKELQTEFADWTIHYFEENEQEGRQTIFCQKP
ncbi:class I SAM-dependent methyltransferase [Neobacillus mesonae]|uniref:SAM-dependent methyltransferase n=2 Tax=Neobacillus mesonae TaxID=1193713 RepID=A0A3T0HZ06_9BACI|nr:class I SAM-dependent methyltransferase [Neobacillus mesonae]AZU62257.1 SAM-dependent methyltransferase [Neobacillus mesonae]